MTIRYLNNEIKLTKDDNYRPNTLIINGELASMAAFLEKNGYNWKPGADGNLLFYLTESGKSYSIPQARLQNTYQDEIREAIASTGKTMKEVAALIGIPYRTLQNYRRGTSAPSDIAKEAIIKRIRACGEIWTAVKESGDFIDQFTTIEDALQAIKGYEAQDEEMGSYTYDFYEVEDGNHHRIAF